MRRIAIALVLLVFSFSITAARELPHPSLGLSWGALTPDNERLIGAGPNNFFYFVQYVDSGSLASRAGIRTNDLISKVDGVRITSPDHLDELIDQAWINDAPSVTITLWRPYLRFNPRDGTEENVVVNFPVPPPPTTSNRMVVQVPQPEFDTALQRCRTTAGTEDCNAIRRHRALKANVERFRQFAVDLIVDCRRYDKTACDAIRPTLQIDFNSNTNPDAVAAVKAAEQFFKAFERCKAGFTDGACDSALSAPELPTELRQKVMAAQSNHPRNLNDPATLWSTIATVIVIGAIVAALVWRVLSTPSLSRGALPTSHRSILTGNAASDPLGQFTAWVRSHIEKIRGTSATAPAAVTPQLRDPDTAQAALKIAHAYLEELDDQDIAEPDTAERARSTLALAARQLQIAQNADPTVTYQHQADNGGTVQITQAKLRAFTVYLEGVTYSESAPKRAIVLLEQAVTLDPECTPAYAKLGLLHYLACDRAEAVAALEQALRLDPNDIELVKLLDRARNMTPAQVLAYKATRATTTTISAARTTYSWGMFALAIGVVIAGLNIAMWAGGGVIEGLALIALFFALPSLARFYKAIGG